MYGRLVKQEAVSLSGGYFSCRRGGCFVAVDAKTRAVADVSRECRWWGSCQWVSVTGGTGSPRHVTRRRSSASRIVKYRTRRMGLPAGPHILAARTGRISRSSTRPHPSNCDVSKDYSAEFWESPFWSVDVRSSAPTKNTYTKRWLYSLFHKSVTIIKLSIQKIVLSYYNFFTYCKLIMVRVGGWLFLAGKHCIGCLRKRLNPGWHTTIWCQLINLHFLS